MNECHEFVVFKFRPKTLEGEQFQLMQNLNSIICEFDGFKSRNYYYSKADNRWIDHITWNDPDTAKRAYKAFMNNPQTKECISKIDDKSVVFSHYEKMTKT